ncbi:Uncharacterised protein [Chlamydia trachomatis]|nr:Uncharacterised protein [Chlamydia trachomatis]
MAQHGLISVLLFNRYKFDQFLRNLPNEISAGGESKEIWNAIFVNAKAIRGSALIARLSLEEYVVKRLF